MRSQLFTVPEVAAHLRCSEWSIKQELRRGDMKGSKIKGRWLVSDRDLAEYERAHAA
jgi:Helix-turn-helix domain